jgi:hypothetical protein
MRADIKVADRRGAQTAAATVLEETLPGQEAGLTRQRFTPIQSRGKGRIQSFDG